MWLVVVSNVTDGSVRRRVFARRAAALAWARRCRPPFGRRTGYRVEVGVLGWLGNRR
jgi:hypothetical protein